MECIVEFEYDANEDDELSLKKGDVITNVTLYEDGWMKGVLNGKEGVFPDNFVKIIKNESKTPDKGDKKTDGFRRSQEDLLGKKTANFDNSNSSGQKAKVIHKYVPQQKDELALEVGMTIDILPPEKGDTDEGWLRGSNAGKIGVFPANFVSLLTPPAGRGVPPPGETTDANYVSGKRVMGVGFGNIFDGEQIQLRPVAMKDVKREADEAANQAPKQAPRPHKKGAQADSQRRPGATRTLGNMETERVIVKFPYQGENADELNINKGDIIIVLDKDLEDDGWWKGELNGRVGVFPDNFVEPLPASAVAPSLAKEEKKPIRPVPPPPSEKPNPPGNFLHKGREKPNQSKRGGPPPVVPKKPIGKSANGRANSIENKGDIFESVPDHQPLSALTSDRPRIANKRPPSKEFLRASGEELATEKDEDNPIVRREGADGVDGKDDPPPRPNHRPVGFTGSTDLTAINPRGSSSAPKATTLPTAPAAPPTAMAAPPLAPAAVVPAAMAAAAPVPGVSAAELAELRTEFAQRLAKEMSELRDEMEQLRLQFTSRLHSLAEEVDEEKRLRLNTKVELERVRRMLQERELSSMSIASASRSSNA